MSALAYGSLGDPERFWLRFSPCAREPFGWKDELFAAARTIAGRAKKSILICSSGGIDSEIACRAFHHEKIPFTVLTLEHTSGTNEHDIRFAKKWCKENDVEQIVMPIDIERFLTEEIDRYAESYAAIHPFRYLQLKLMEIAEERDAFAVMGSGEQLYYPSTLERPFTKADMRLPLSNGTAMPLEWCKDHATEHEPYFHYATPELSYAYLRIPLVRFALEHPDPLFRHAANTYTIRRVAYQSYWPDLELRYKADGFDRIRPQYIAARDRLRARFNDRYVAVDPSADEVERQLRGVSYDA